MNQTSFSEMGATRTSVEIPLQVVSAPLTARETDGLEIREHAISLPRASDIVPIDETDAKAWLSVLGAFLFLFPTYGFMQTIGTVQSYLELHQLSSYTSRDVGWITGVFTALALFLGIQIGPMLDTYGPKALGMAGSAIYIPVFFVLAECREYWHFMLVLGVWGACGAAIISIVGVAAVGKSFVRRRGLALGIALCGSSVGGVVMPLMLRSLLPRLGWTWSIRVLAFVIAAVTIGGLCCMQQLSLQHVRSRGPAAHRRKALTLNFKALTSGTFTFVTIGLSALEFAIFGVFSLLPTYANAANFSADTGFLLVAIANATSTAGRVLPGLAGDHFGHFNVLLGMILLTAALTAAILVPFGASSLVALYAFAALWGFGSGSFISLTPVCMGKTCETDDYGRYFGWSRQSSVYIYGPQLI
ncbi:major facilitator superfamily transporter [Seiridium cupressi]